MHQVYPLNSFSCNSLPKAIFIKYPRFKKLLGLVGSLDNRIPRWPSIDDAVLYAVIGQMLSFTAAQSIIRRLIEKFGSAHNVIIWAGKSSFRKGPVYGVSRRKRKALAEWNKYALNKNGFRAKWGKMPLEDYRNEICSVWGFGIWASDMLAIFYAGRNDIWPESDAGINKACRVIFGSAKHEEIKSLIKGSETLVALYLWELINRKIGLDSLSN